MGPSRPFSSGRVPIGCGRHRQPFGCRGLDTGLDVQRQPSSSSRESEEPFFLQGDEVEPIVADEIAQQGCLFDDLMNPLARGDNDHL